MQITLMNGRIHRATVATANLHSESSIDRALLDAAGLVIKPVEVYNFETGGRFATDVVETPGPDTLDLNGADARAATPRDMISVGAYASRDEAEARTFRSRVVLVGREDRILQDPDSTDQ